MEGLDFPKSERLCGKRHIDSLFSSGKRLQAHPFRLVMGKSMSAEDKNGIVSILVSVPKRSFKKANQRNRIKRQLREAWRLSKNPLLEKISSRPSEIPTKALHIAFLYISGKAESWETILEAMQKSIKLISGKLDSL